MSDSASRVELGRLDGPWGTDGWVKVFSLTGPPEQIFDYQPWCIDRSPGLLQVLEWRRQGPRLIARVEPVETREQAEAMRGTLLSIDRNRLPAPATGQYYWHDLVGLRVVNQQGADLGRVRSLLDAGVHDVLQIDRGKDFEDVLIPFVSGHYVLGVELKKGIITVDWDPAWSDAD
ncbi:MAG: ribosome maturation factor RimM [Xanthomonadaceae bacterium]|nr:ribosome maturation factor RimM [Xanthomonadaceae bacterium]